MPGFVVPDINALKAIVASVRAPDLPICVGSEDSWYLYKPSATAAETLPNVVEPDDAIGRWYKMQAAPPTGGGVGTGGAATIAVISAPPNTVPGAIGESVLQYSSTSGNQAVQYNDSAYVEQTFTLDYKITRRSLWIATGTTPSSWVRASSADTEIEYLNIADSYKADWFMKLGVIYLYDRASAMRELGCHPEFVGERITEFFRDSATQSFKGKQFVATGVAPGYWPDNDGYTTPSVLNFRWKQSFDFESSKAIGF